MVQNTLSGSRSTLHQPGLALALASCDGVGTFGFGFAGGGIFGGGGPSGGGRFGGLALAAPQSDMYGFGPLSSIPRL